MSLLKDNPLLMRMPTSQKAWTEWARELSRAVSSALAGPVNLLIDGLVKFKFLTTSTPTTEFVIYSSQTSSPFANAFIRFREPDGTTKAVMGFTAAGDNTFSITSYEDFRLKFRTGKVGDPTDFTNRAIMYGNATSSWIGVVSANAADIGGCFIRFTEDDDSVTKGYVGYTSTTDDDLDILNTVTDAHVTMQTAGIGAVKILPGGTEALRVKSTGQTNFVALAGAPATQVADGDVYYDSGTSKLRVRAGGAWVDLH